MAQHASAGLILLNDLTQASANGTGGTQHIYAYALGANADALTP